MKKFFSLLFFAVLSLTSKAQLTKGNWLMGGHFMYSKQRSKGDEAIHSKSRWIEVAPNIGLFVHDKLATGIRLDVNLTRQKYPQLDNTNIKNVQNNYGVGPFVRYYFLSYDNRVNIFSDASLQYRIIESKGTGRLKDVSKDLGYELSAGSVVFLNTSVGLEFLLNYRNIKSLDIKSRGDELQFKIGFQFHLERE